MSKSRPSSWVWDLFVEGFIYGVAMEAASWCFKKVKRWICGRKKQKERSGVREGGSD